MDDWTCRLLNVSSDLIEVTTKVAVGEMTRREAAVPLEQVAITLRGIVRDRYKGLDEEPDSPSDHVAAIIRLFDEVMSTSP